MNENSQGSRKIPRAAFVVSVLLLVAVVPLVAWFNMTDRLSRTEDLHIDMPPIIYIKDDNLQEITSFHLDNLRIGEESNTVFCVSPAIVGSVDKFMLGVIYTENLGMNINLYPVSSVTAAAPTDGRLSEERFVTNESGTDSATVYFNFSKTQNSGSGNIADIYQFKETYGDWKNEIKPGPGNLNNGIYKAYNGLLFSKDTKPETGIIDNLNDTSRYRFFILNITWNSEAIAENVKEADIVYIVSSGMR